jgi:adenosine kinase
MAGLASFGANGCFVGKVKSDRLGFSFAEDLRRIGVDFDTAMASKGPSTACCVIAVTPDGHRSMSTYLGASRELTPEDINPKQVGSASILYVEGYMWDPQSHRRFQRRRPEGRLHAFRPVLRRPLSR